MRKLRFSPKTQQIITYLFYFIFFIFSVYQIFQTDNLTHKILYAVFSILILGIALYSEYLKHLYKKAIYKIAFDCDPIQAENQMNDLLKKDFFKAYKNEKIIFDTLVYVDQNEFQACLDHLEKNYEFFHASLDQLLIYHFNVFYCSWQLNDIDKAIDEYNKMLRMKNKKTKGAKANALYNWEYIEALYQLARKEYKQSYNAFKKVNITNMNPRELVQYHTYFAQVCAILKNKAQQKEHLEAIKQYHGKSKICLGGMTE